jgi:hypothetical protein
MNARIAATEDENTSRFEAPDFGIGYPNITEAAELVVMDMAYSGQIEESPKPPEDLDGDARHQWLKAALAEQMAAFEEHLLSGIESGSLKASAIKWTPDNRPIPEETHVASNDLVDWMEERNINTGDYMFEWQCTEGQIYGLICDEVAFLRSVQRTSNRGLEDIERQRFMAKRGMLDNAELLVEVQAALKAKMAEISDLKNQLKRQVPQSERVDKPLHTRERRTLLVIIASLCELARIKFDMRGAAQKIKTATEVIGAPVDDGTIDKVLRAIPEALETRMK